MWGSSFTLIKIAVVSIEPLAMTSLRQIVASVFLAAVALWSRQSIPRGRRIWALMIASAIFGNALPFVLISWAEQHVESGLAAILMGVMPLTTLLLAHLFTHDEEMNRWKLAGVAAGMTGLVILMGPAKLAGLGDDFIRQGAIALAAVSYGVSALIVKNITAVPHRIMAAIIIALSALIITPIAFLAGQPVSLQAGLSPLMAVVTLGLVQTALATLVMFTIIRRQGATFFSQINFLVPLFGVLAGFVFLGEIPSLNALTALVVILSGIFLARRGMKQKKQHANML